MLYLKCVYNCGNFTSGIWGHTNRIFRRHLQNYIWTKTQVKMDLFEVDSIYFELADSDRWEMWKPEDFLVVNQ